MRSRSRDAGRPGGAHTPPDVARGKKGPGRRRDHIRKKRVVTSEKTSAHFRNWHLTKHTQDGARADAVQPEAPQAGSPAGSSFSGGVLTLGSEKGAVLGSVAAVVDNLESDGSVCYRGLLLGSSGGGLQLKAVRFELSGGLAERYDVWYRSCDSARLARLGERRRASRRRVRRLGPHRRPGRPRREGRVTVNGKSVNWLYLH